MPGRRRLAVLFVLATFLLRRRELFGGGMGLDLGADPAFRQAPPLWDSRLLPFRPCVILPGSSGVFRNLKVSDISAGYPPQPHGQGGGSPDYGDRETCSEGQCPHVILHGQSARPVRDQGK